MSAPQGYLQHRFEAVFPTRVRFLHAPSQHRCNAELLVCLRDTVAKLIPETSTVMRDASRDEGIAWVSMYGLFTLSGASDATTWAAEQPPDVWRAAGFEVPPTPHAAAFGLSLVQHNSHPVVYVALTVCCQLRDHGLLRVS